MSTDRSRPPAQRDERLAVDRVACRGHGVCAALLPDSVGLDEWGYPILLDGFVGADLVDRAIRMCPARALYRAAGSPVASSRVTGWPTR